MNNNPAYLMKRLEAYVSANFPHARVGALRPPAADALIRSVEEELGLTLPGDVRAMYAIHDGVTLPDGRYPSQDDAPPIVLPYFHWLPIADLLKRWKRFNAMPLESELSTGDPLEASAVRPFQYHRAWLPVAISLTEDTAFLDLNPTSQGIAGQLIRTDMASSATLLCESFTNHIENMLDLVERGKISPDVTSWKGM